MFIDDDATKMVLAAQAEPTIPLVYHLGRTENNGGMDVREIRRKNMRALSEAHDGGELAAVARRLGKSPTQVGHLIGKNPTRNIGPKIAREVEAAYGKPKGWLDWIHELDQVAEPPVAAAPALGPMSNVPVVGTTQGGAPERIWIEEGYPVGYSDEVLDVPAKDQNAYALRVVGNSMSPRMREGEYIMLYPNQEPQPGDEVVVRTTCGEVMVKALAYIRNGEVAFDSIAKGHDRIVRKMEDIIYMHFVAGIHPAAALRKQL